MKTFEDRQEFFSILNKMWNVFQTVASIPGHEKQIEEYEELKDRASELLVKDVRNTDVTDVNAELLAVAERVIAEWNADWDMPLELITMARQAAKKAK